jgi:class 3 adenylate cyclase/alpha-beta hydrolase superfamily lysophospholipase
MASGEQIPETQYATLGEDRIAYQVFGQGKVDLLYVPVSGDCIDLRWDYPPFAAFLFWLGTQARVISFDRRGAGASDAPSGEPLPSWERWADDARAVLDAVGSERAVIAGAADSGPTAILFAASHPTRTQGLILINSTARWAAAPDYPAGLPEEALAVSSQFLQDGWGTEAMAELAAPDLARRDPQFRRHMARITRTYMSPREAKGLFQVHLSLDVREALASIRVPSLVLQAEGLEFIPPAHGRYLAEHIAGARLALVPGNDLAFDVEPAVEAVRPLIKEFLSRLHGAPEPDRLLAAVLFTDIVGSTERASALGDQAWRNLLESHDAVARTVVEQHRGRLVKMTGDGMLATFDGPGRAIRCAMAMGDALRPLGLEIRAGLHTGEVEVRGTDIAGIGVHIAARVIGCAQPGDLLVSAAVPMLVAGSGIEFEDRGEHELKGVSEPWRLCSVKG